MRILLTGASGFIGSNLARLALGRGHQIAGLFRPNSTIPPLFSTDTNATRLTGTLTDAPWKQIAAFDPEVCIHAAWITTPGVYLESPENCKYLESSVNFLRQLRELGTRHVVGLGSCIEYAESCNALSEEDAQIKPATLYASCKNDLRLALEADSKSGQLLTCWCRIFYPYGEGEHPDRLCSSIIHKLNRGTEVILKTPDSTNDFIYIDDVADALVTVMEAKYKGCINIGTGVGVKVRDIANTIAEMLDVTSLITESPQVEANISHHVVADATRLRELGWRPGHTALQGLQKLVAAHGRI